MKKRSAVVLGAFMMTGIILSFPMTTYMSKCADDNLSEKLERSYNLLNQFITQQRESGNPAFLVAYLESGRSKVGIGYDGWHGKEFLSCIKEFMKANNIDENLIFYLEAQ